MESKQPTGKSTVLRRIALIVVALIVTGFVASCADWAVQGMRVRRASNQLVTEFPRGIPVADAQKIVVTKYPEHSDYSALECQRWSHSIPSYPWRGGPCVFGIVRIGATWWGFESAVEFRLIFGPDDRLRDLHVDPVYTFL